jgi:cytochrome c oxidase cbb3-type subunit 3
MIRSPVATGAFVLAAMLAGDTLLAQGGGRGGFVAYPPRTVDPAAANRGKVLYSTNCAFCHGSDAHGGDGGGPNIER